MRNDTVRGRGVKAFALAPARLAENPFIRRVVWRFIAAAFRAA